MSWPWSELGLPGPAGPEEVKHAYAQRLKEVHPEENPEAFQQLHRAYQTARRLTRTSSQAQTEAENLDVDPLPSQQAEDDVGGEEPLEEDRPNWDFASLLSQGEQEDGPEDEIPEEEESAWVPPVYATQPPRRRLHLRDSQKALVLIAVLFVIAVVLNWPTWSPKGSAAKAAETEKWLEHTFQLQFVSSPQNEDREEDRFLYWLKEDPDVRFQAIWSEDGAYQTNYTNVQLFWAMKDFSQDWPDYPLWFDQEMTDQVGEGAQGGSPPILFLFQVPLEGAEEFLCALGDQLEQIAQTDWYVKQPPEYLVALAHGEAILCSYDSSARDMPTSTELLSYYQENLCGPLLEDLLFQQDVVLWDYPNDEDLIWANTGEGSVLDEDGWWISCRGTGREGTDLTMYYFLRDDYSALYCISAAALDDFEQIITLSCTETRTMSCGQQVEIYRII